MSEWQPIETAPKDGTAILAYNPMIGAYSTAYTTRFVPDKPYGGGFPCGYWPNGTPGSDNFGRWDCQPTHWLPLPPPPTLEESI